MQKKIITLIMCVMFVFGLIWMCSTEVCAEENTTYITLSDSGVKVNEEEISTDTNLDVYLTNKTNNGSTGAEATAANVDVANIINVKKAGTYEITGTLSDGQIAINAKELDGNVTIILNNASITCKDAPAILVYNTNEQLLDKSLTIKTVNGTTNSLTGARIKEDILGWEKQEEIVYYIEKGYEEDNTYYEEYKYNGAISSDISLVFEGEGTLEITSTKKEGIETRGDVTFNSGKYIIKAEDDGINACTDKESVITINGGEVLVDVSAAEEGDGIDSNGYLYINGGTLCSFASEVSQDSGIDADLGIVINGGNVVATGEMSDAISSDSKQEVLQIRFSKEVQKDTLLAITDANSNALVAFKANNKYSNLTISSAKLTGQDYKIYENGTIEGTNNNGFYTEITSYNQGELREAWSSTGFGNPKEMFNNFENRHMKENVENNEEKDKIFCYILIVLAVLLVIFVIIAIIMKIKKKAVSKVTIFIIGMLIGAILAITGVLAYNKANESEVEEEQKVMENQMMQMRENREMPTGENKPTDMQEPPTGNAGEDMAKPEEQTTTPNV